MKSSLPRSRGWVLGWLAAVFIGATASAVSAETLLMPPRSYRSTTSEVVWGVTTQNVGTPFVLDYGDGAANQTTGTVTDRSYIAFNHTYALANTYTVTLCVGAGAVVPGCPGEQATVVVQVYSVGSLSPIEVRNLDINRAIQDGLRYLWTAQTGRQANFPGAVTTDWGGLDGYTGPNVALAVLAFENHGYKLPDNQNAPTGIYEKYVVRRGINQLGNLLRTFTLTVQPAGNPCVGVGGDCVGVYLNQDISLPPNFSHSSYESGIAVAALAGSGAMNRTFTNEIPGTNNSGYVVNKSYGEIVQRMANALAFGQLENTTNGNGGWSYGLNYTGQQASDGSTVGWTILGLLDAQGAGATMAPFVATQWAAVNQGVNAHMNNDGSFDYQSDRNRASNNSVNIAKTGVGIQGLYFAGRPSNDPDLANALSWISTRWANTTSNPLGQAFNCNNGTYNKGCAYGMYNVFKGLKLYGVTSLPGVNRAAGPFPIPANDWYADYVDYLLANQTNPTSTTGGLWAGVGVNNLVFSSQTTNDPAEAALAELILAPVALVAPDQQRFGSFGLQHGSPLSPNPDTNTVNTNHTVTAKAESGGANPAPIPGVTIAFQVTGRNALTTGGGTCAPVNCASGADGVVTFTYHDNGAANAGGDDNIQAFIGQVGGQPASNVLLKHWVIPAGLKCDADLDGRITLADLRLIAAANGRSATGPNDPLDGNGDGSVNVLDARYCQIKMAQQPPLGQ